MEALLERLREMLQGHDNVDPNSVQVIFTEFGGSSLNIRLIAFIYLADWGQFKREVERVNLKVMRIVEELGLSMAFPSVSVYMESVPQEAGEQAPKLVPPSRKRAELKDTPSSDVSYQANETESSDSDGDER
jgi:MscS family membrane protein